MSVVRAIREWFEQRLTAFVRVCRPEIRRRFAGWRLDLGLDGNSFWNRRIHLSTLAMDFIRVHPFHNLHCARGSPPPRRTPQDGIRGRRWRRCHSGTDGFVNPILLPVRISSSPSSSKLKLNRISQNWKTGFRVLVKPFLVQVLVT